MKSAIPFEKIDNYVRERFRCSFMSDTKWKKLFNALGDVSTSGFTIRYKLIHGNQLGELSLDQADDQFFAEQIHYKEVEWIKFPSEHEEMVEVNNRKAGKRLNQQDLSEKRAVANSLGEFESEDLVGSLRIYAYR